MNDNLFAGFVNPLSGGIGTAIGSFIEDVPAVTGNLVDDLGDALLTSDGDNIIYSE